MQPIGLLGPFIIAVSAVPVGVYALEAGPPADREPGIDAAQMRTELWAAIGAEGEAYREFRDRLLSRGGTARPWLLVTARDGKTWQERVMAEIMLERLAKPAEIAATVDWWRRAPFDRLFVENWRHLGRSLATKAVGTPMLLVEKIWKGNELHHPAFVSRHQDGVWETDALGWLREKRALFPLIVVLTRRYEQPAATLCVDTAARALGLLKEKTAIPALCEAYILYASQRAGSACIEAIESCGDRDSSQILRDYADRTGSGGARDQLLELADKLERRGR